MTTDPINLTPALASIDRVYSPRIVARVNDYDVRIAHARGDPHVHDDTDEFFLVLADEFDIALRERRIGNPVVDVRAIARRHRKTRRPPHQGRRADEQIARLPRALAHPLKGADHPPCVRPRVAPGMGAPERSRPPAPATLRRRRPQ
jgi:hypothetical protein